MKKDNFNLKNKFAIVIGGSGLIGKQIVDDLSSLGSKVLVLDIIDYKVKKNTNIFFNKYDISKTHQFKKILNKIIKKFGCPDIFINASYPRTKNWNKSNYKYLTLTELVKNINLQLNTFIWSALKVAELMKRFRKKGSIIIINSIYGKIAQDKNLYKNSSLSMNPVYSAVKGGLISFVKNLSSYYGEYGIRANSIICGGIKGHSASTNKKLNKKFINKYSEKTILKRMGSPIDISSSVLFLSSDLSSYITGTEITVDGGYTSI